MRHRKFYSWLPIVVFTLLTSLHIKAQSVSYLYLEGIRGLPSFIEIDNAPKAAMGKNYVLIPLEKSGEIQVNINFNGNLYPKQNFVLDALPGSSYAFRLAKTADDKFYLMDLINTGKIVELNTNVNIALTTDQNKINFFVPSTRPQVDTLEEANKAKRKRKRKNDSEVPTDSVQLTETRAQNGIVAVYTDKEIEQKASEAQPVVAEKKQNPPQAAPKQEPNCKRMSSEEEVVSTIDKLRQKNDDDTRLLILKRRVFTGCLEVRSIKQIAELFDTQFGRYGAIRFLRNFMKDPENLGELDPLFKTNSYKEKLMQLK